jgi:hypothetical protein
MRWGKNVPIDRILEIELDEGVNMSRDVYTLEFIGGLLRYD